MDTSTGDGRPYGDRTGAQDASGDDAGLEIFHEPSALDVPSGASLPDALDGPARPAGSPDAAATDAAGGGRSFSAHEFQDVIALRREAEESAAAALNERREATSQASRIIEEALRAAELLHSEAQQSLDERRTRAEAEATSIVERARAEAAEIVKAGENDVLEAQRLRREAAAERDRLNAELERIRRTAQEELFAEANRHTARMDEIRTRVLHGVEAATDGLRELVRDPGTPASSPYGDTVVRPAAAASYLAPAPAEVVEPAPAVEANPPVEPALPVEPPPAASPQESPYAGSPVGDALTGGPPWSSPSFSEPVHPTPPVEPTPPARPTPTDEHDRGRRGWRSRRS